MKREIKNSGEYLEVNADSILSQIEAMSNAQIIVITKSRIELAGEDKAQFLKRLKGLIESCDREMNGLDESQRCDFLLRRMILEYGIQFVPPISGVLSKDSE